MTNNYDVIPISQWLIKGFYNFMSVPLFHLSERRPRVAGIPEGVHSSLNLTYFSLPEALRRALRNPGCA